MAATRYALSMMGGVSCWRPLVSRVRKGIEEYRFAYGGEASRSAGPARTEYSEANYRKECKHLKVCDDARPCGRTQGRHMPIQNGYGEYHMRNNKKFTDQRSRNSSPWRLWNMRPRAVSPTRMRFRCTACTNMCMAHGRASSFQCGTSFALDRAEAHRTVHQQVEERLQLMAEVRQLDEEDESRHA